MNSKYLSSFENKVIRLMGEGCSRPATKVVLLLIRLKIRFLNKAFQKVTEIFSTLFTTSFHKLNDLCRNDFSTSFIPDFSNSFIPDFSNKTTLVTEIIPIIQSKTSFTPNFSNKTTLVVKGFPPQHKPYYLILK